MIKNQFSAKLHLLRYDNGGEYDNNKFREYFQTHGLYHETTCSQTSQQNGIVERKNRHMLKMASALLIIAHTPCRYWTNAIIIAVYLLNRMPSRILDFKASI